MNWWASFRKFAMTDQPQTSAQTTVTDLNGLPISQHILTLFAQEKVTPESQLAIVSLVLWATENLAASGRWAEVVDGAAAWAVTSNPQAVYDDLADDRMLQTTTLREAGMMVLRHLADLIPPSELGGRSRRPTPR